MLGHTARQSWATFAQLFGAKPLETPGKAVRGKSLSVSLRQMTKDEDGRFPGITNVPRTHETVMAALNEAVYQETKRAERAERERESSGRES